MLSRRVAIVAAAWWALVAPMALRHADAAPAKVPASIQAAIATLRAEYAEHVRDPKRPVRELCDYFEKDKPADVTPDAILTTLEQPIMGDLRTVCYIRWQLLSAVPENLDDAPAARALELYRKAPPPAPRYGLAAAEQSALDAALRTARKQDDALLTAQLAARVKEAAAANRHLLAYRNELYRRLAKKPESFKAALLDALERQNAAAGAEDWVPTVIADVQAWAVLVGQPEKKQLLDLAEFIGQLRTKPVPMYYSYAAVRSDKLTWVRASDSIDNRRKLANLQQLLIEKANGL